MRRRRFGALVAVALACGACDSLPFGYTDIGDVARDPARYEGQRVKVKGTVKDVTKIPLVGIRVYVLRDETGEIYVVPRDTLPPPGAHVGVRGVVDSAIVLSGITAGTRVREASRW